MSTWYDEQAGARGGPVAHHCGVRRRRHRELRQSRQSALSPLERTPYDVIGTLLSYAPSTRPSSANGCAKSCHLATIVSNITWTSPSGVRRELGVNVARLLTRTASDVSHVLVFFVTWAEWRQHEIELRRLKGMNALGQMAAGFAHEVRNPLAAMRSLAEALKGEMAADDPRIEYPTRMLNLTSRIDSLVKDALRFGRPKAPSFSVHAPQQLIAETFDTLAPRLGPWSAPCCRDRRRTPTRSRR